MLQIRPSTVGGLEPSPSCHWGYSQKTLATYHRLYLNDPPAAAWGYLFRLIQQRTLDQSFLKSALPNHAGENVQSESCGL